MAKILIVEDDQFLREFYQELLEEEGYLVETAADGEAGFNKIKADKYALVLLDIMLPKKDGIQILRDLKASSPDHKSTIVVLTNLGQDSVVKECFNLGARGYLIKSALNPEQVLSEVKSYLQKASG